MEMSSDTADDRISNVVLAEEHIAGTVLAAEQISNAVISKECVPGVLAEEHISHVISEECVPGVLAEEEHISDVKSEECVPGVLAEEHISGVTSEECVPGVLAEEHISDITSEECVPGVLAEEHISDITSEEYVPGVLAEEHVSDNVIAKENISNAVLDKEVQVNILPEIESKSLHHKHSVDATVTGDKNVRKPQVAGTAYIYDSNGHFQYCVYNYPGASTSFMNNSGITLTEKEQQHYYNGQYLSMQDLSGNYKDVGEHEISNPDHAQMESYGLERQYLSPQELNVFPGEVGYEVPNEDYVQMENYDLGEQYSLQQDTEGAHGYVVQHEMSNPNHLQMKMYAQQSFLPSDLSTLGNKQPPIYTGIHYPIVTTQPASILENPQSHVNMAVNYYPTTNLQPASLLENPPSQVDAGVNYPIITLQPSSVLENPQYQINADTTYPLMTSQPSAVLQNPQSNTKTGPNCPIMTSQPALVVGNPQLQGISSINNPIITSPPASISGNRQHPVISSANNPTVASQLGTILPNPNFRMYTPMPYPPIAWQYPTMLGHRLSFVNPVPLNSVPALRYPSISRQQYDTDIGILNPRMMPYTPIIGNQNRFIAPVIAWKVPKNNRYQNNVSAGIVKHTVNKQHQNNGNKHQNNGNSHQNNVSTKNSTSNLQHEGVLGNQTNGIMETKTESSHTVQLQTEIIGNERQNDKESGKEACKVLNQIQNSLKPSPDHIQPGTNSPGPLEDGADMGHNVVHHDTSNIETAHAGNIMPGIGLAVQQDNNITEIADKNRQNDAFYLSKTARTDTEPVTASAIKPKIAIEMGGNGPQSDSFLLLEPAPDHIVNEARSISQPETASEMGGNESQNESFHLLESAVDHIMPGITPPLQRETVTEMGDNESQNHFSPIDAVFKKSQALKDIITATANCQQYNPAQKAWDALNKICDELSMCISSIKTTENDLSAGMSISISYNNQTIMQRIGKGITEDDAKYNAAAHIIRDMMRTFCNCPYHQ